MVVNGNHLPKERVPIQSLVFSCSKPVYFTQLKELCIKLYTNFNEYIFYKVSGGNITCLFFHLTNGTDASNFHTYIDFARNDTSW